MPPSHLVVVVVQRALEQQQDAVAQLGAGGTKARQRRQRRCSHLQAAGGVSSGSVGSCRVCRVLVTPCVVAGEPVQLCAAPCPHAPLHAYMLSKQDTAVPLGAPSHSPGSRGCRCSGCSALHNKSGMEAGVHGVSRHARAGRCLSLLAQALQTAAWPSASPTHPTPARQPAQPHHAPGSLVAGPSSPSRCRSCPLRDVDPPVSGGQGEGGQARRVFPGK